MKFPISDKEELELVTNNDINPLIEYISIYINMVLDRYQIDTNTRKYLEKVITDNIIVARNRFLKDDPTNKNYKFSAYFSWYIHELLEKGNYKKKPNK